METTRRPRRLQPDLKVIGLTLYEQTSYLEEMAEVGACGYVLKTASPSEIVQAIRTVSEGGTYFEASIPRHVRAAGRAPTATEELSERELAVAKLLANGRTKSQIAESLGLSVSEVDTRRSAAMNKLGLRNRAEFVRIAQERGWFGG